MGKISELELTLGEMKFLVKGLESMSNYPNDNETRESVIGNCSYFCRLLTEKLERCELLSESIAKGA